MKLKQKADIRTGVRARAKLAVKAALGVIGLGALISAAIFFGSINDENTTPTTQDGNQNNTNAVLGNTGPGGVGDASTNKLWLKPELGITYDNQNRVASWADAGGNGEDLQQSTNSYKPLLNTNGLNGYPVLTFDGSNDRLEDNSITGGNYQGDYTFFIVMKPNVAVQGKFHSIFNSRKNCGNGGSQDSYQIDYDNGGNLNHFIANNNQRTSFGTAGTSWTVLAVVYKGDKVKTYRNGSQVSSNNVGNNKGNLIRSYVLGINRNCNAAMSADVAEVIMYNLALNKPQLYIVNSYLDAKYNLGLYGNTYFAYSATHSGDVAGIGRHENDEYHDDAWGGIVRMFNPSALDDDDYLMWGHDNGSTSSSNTSDVPSGVNNRCNKVWRVTETDGGDGDGVGTVSIEFDLSGFTIANPNDLVLLVDADGVFATGAQQITSGFTYNATSHHATFTGVDFNDGDFFTIASMGPGNTLPISLLSFDAIWKGSKVEVSWQTATEENNDYFTIERSENGLFFEEIGTVPGAGNSNEVLKYTFVDQKPLDGISYYRLRQTDFDGKFKYFDVRAVKGQQAIPESTTGIEIANIGPNPFGNNFNCNFIAPADEEIDVQLLNTNGQVLFKGKIQANEGGNTYHFDQGMFLPEGTYFFVMTRPDQSTAMVKVLKST